MTEGTSITSWRKVGRITVAASAAVMLSAAALAPPASAADGASGTGSIQAKTLKCTVGPGFTLALDKETVPAGKYKLTIDDKSTIHNCHITGAGVDVKTEVGFTGKKTFKIKLKRGTYTAVCDPHSGSMVDSLTVT